VIKKTLVIKKTFWVLVLILLSSNIYAQPEVNINVEYDKNSYSLEDIVIIAISCNIPAGYHLYSNPLGPGIGKPLNISVKTNKNIQWIDARKEIPKKYKPDIGGWVWAYESKATFFLTGVLKENIDKEKKEINDTIILDALICKSVCIPFYKEIPISIKLSDKKSSNISFENNKKLQKLLLESKYLPFNKIGAKQNLAQNLNADLLTKNTARGNLNKLSEKNDKETIHELKYNPRENQIKFNIIYAILFAFLAGAILNAMPCVLPVLGIKILSFSQGRGIDKKVAVFRSLVFTVGIISVFIILATCAAFFRMSWGEQFQKPAFIISIVCLIFVFGLGLLDVYIILVPTTITELEKETVKAGGYINDFFYGVFATILATPCSGPLLGATLAWTLTQSTVIIYTIFISLGIGMSFPYVLFATSDRLSSLIPKPGAWMEDFKHFLAFLLFGFAVYLMIGLPKDSVLPTLGLCVVLAFVLMIYKRFSPFGSALKRKISVGMICVLIAFLGWYLNFEIFYNLTSTEAALRAEDLSVKWEDFSFKKLNNAHKQGRHVIVDFTASWCMNCQFNKITVYYTKEVNELIRSKNIVALKADITTKNEEAEALLHHLGSKSVPFLAIFPGNDPYHPVIMRDIVRKKTVLNVLKKLKDKGTGRPIFLDATG